MPTFEVQKKMTLVWRIEAKNKDEAFELADDLNETEADIGDHFGKTLIKQVKICGDPECKCYMENAGDLFNDGKDYWHCDVCDYAEQV